MRAISLTRRLARFKVRHCHRKGGIFNQFPLEESMSSTASLITLLASVAFGLIVVAALVRVGGTNNKTSRRP